LHPFEHAGPTWLGFGCTAATGDVKGERSAGSLPGEGAPPTTMAVTLSATTFVTINMIVSSSWSQIQDRPAEDKNRGDLP